MLYSLGSLSSTMLKLVFYVRFLKQILGFYMFHSRIDGFSFRICFVLFLIEFVHFIERSVPSLVHGQKDLKLSRVLQISLFRFLVLGC